MFLVLVLICVLSTCDAEDIKKFQNGDNAINVSAAILVSAACTVCLIVMLWGCADFCYKLRGRTFRDYNEDAFSPEVVETHRSTSNFSMFPPVESTPRVVIEPLPDITKLRAAQVQHSNQQRLRPRIGIGAERSWAENGDDVDSGRRENLDKNQLNALIRNVRYQIPRSQLQYIRELGVGWFGKVIQGEGDQIMPGHKKTKVIIEMLREEADEQDQLSFLQESLPYREIDHTNVLKLLGACMDTLPYLIVVEFCHFGDLKTYMLSHRGQVGSFSEKGLLLKFACDIASGLQALHEKNFVHRDLAARNCLLASDLSVKIGDYGLSETIFKEDYFVDKAGDSIPVRWLCPDCVTFDDKGTLTLKAFTKDDNVWTYGVVLWEVVQFCALPYPELTTETVISHVLHQRAATLPPPDATVLHADRIHSLVQLCQLERSQRPSLRELKIMLLHLMSYREATDKASDSFQHKWNQLMPRRLQNRTTTASEAAAAPSPVMTSRSMPSAALPNTSTPMSSGREVVASVTVHREADRSSLSGDRGDWQPLSLGAVIGKTNPVSSPVNNVSLEDELGALGGGGGKRGVEGFGNDAYADENDATNQTSSWCELPASEDRGGVVTSTPRKPLHEDDDFLVVSRSSTSEPSSRYEMALTSQLSSSSPATQGQGQSSSIAALSHNQFSTWLQTVPMSLDGDDGDSLNEAPTASDTYHTIGDSFFTVSADSIAGRDFAAAERDHNKFQSGDHRTDDSAVDDNIFF